MLAEEPHANAMLLAQAVAEAAWQTPASKDRDHAQNCRAIVLQTG